MSSEVHDCKCVHCSEEDDEEPLDWLPIAPEIEEPEDTGWGQLEVSDPKTLVCGKLRFMNNISVFPPKFPSSDVVAQTHFFS